MLLYSILIDAGGYGNVLLNQTRKLAEICAEKRTNFPIILGRDCSGVVEVTGKGVVPSRLKPGDKVTRNIQQQ